jgi:hypothetical protein
MEKIETIEHVLENMGKNIVYKVKGSILKSLLLLCFGIISIAVYASNEVKPTNTIPQFLFVAGSICIICGILLFFFRKSYFVTADNHQKLKEKQIYFQAIERDKLLKLIETGNLNEIKTLNTSVSDGLKLRVISTQDGHICLSQVNAYVSNEFINLNTVKNHSKEEACFFADYFKQNKI